MLQTGVRNYLRPKMTLPEHLSPRCDQDSISSDHSMRTMTNNCSSCTGPKKRPGMMVQFHQCDATALRLFGEHFAILLRKLLMSTLDKISYENMRSSYRFDFV